MTVPQPAPLPASIPSPAGPQETPHIAPVGALLAVWIALLVLTLVTLLAARLPTEGLPAAGLWIAMGIATVKATLVALYFMHLRYDRPFHAIIFVTALVFVLLLVSLTLMDSEQYQPDIRRYREQTRQP
jgi:cytochrome c oxidase subunit 4